MTIAETELFSKEAVFVETGSSRDAVFESVAKQLSEKNLVKDGFLAHLEEREDNYPTGIDTTPISDKLANVAIPHTEGEYVNARMVVPIKLAHPIKFKNMIKPSEELEVKFLFMILNNDPEGQANILAQIMDFLAKTPVDKLNELFGYDDPAKIYDFLVANFK